MLPLKSGLDHPQKYIITEIKKTAQSCVSNLLRDVFRKYFQRRHSVSGLWLYSPISKIFCTNIWLSNVSFKFTSLNKSTRIFKCFPQSEFNGPPVSPLEWRTTFFWSHIFEAFSMLKRVILRKGAHVVYGNGCLVCLFNSIFSRIIPLCGVYSFNHCRVSIGMNGQKMRAMPTKWIYAFITIIKFDG